METSQYIQYIQKFFSGLVTSIVTTLNGTKLPQPYYHKRFLRTEFSVDGKWESINAANTNVMADVVAMDSSLPLKRRDSISKASGDIPKMGMEMALREKQLTDLDTLALRPGTEQQLVQKFFADTPRVITGVFERNEAIFLEALSTGVCLVDDIENVGTGIRLNFGVPTVNRHGVPTVWSNVASTPLSDLEGVRTSARLNGDIIIKFLMDRTAFNNMAKTTEVKEHFAFSVGFAGSNVITPSFDQVNTLTTSRGYTIEIIERSVRYEKNGVQTPMIPWADGQVVGITTEQLGSLMWANLAEALHPVAGVSYETADQYILVSKFRTNRPSLAEFTNSQARVVPVLTNTDQLYYVDSKTVGG